ncbi:MAG TPA: hypothetical protein VNA19_11660 [Pyrinomonadaceae bacterium]|nr:hypothetical protein [Pyrinomonadaceae bacterium]
MAGIGSIPPRPQLETPNAEDPDFANKQLRNQEIMMNWQMAVQEVFNQQKQEAELKSNLMKKADEAMESMIRNLA